MGRLGDGGYGVVRGAHLRQHLVEPLQGPVQVDLDPARRRRHVLSVVLRPPALHERHPDSAHLGQLVHRLEAVVHALGQQLRELPVVEDLQRAAGRNLAHGRRMEAVMVIAVTTLHEYRSVRQTFRVHFPPYVIQMHSLPYVTPCVFYSGVSIDVTELPKAEPIAVVRRISEAVDDNRMGVTVEHFTHPTV